MSSSSNRGITPATDQARFDPIIGEFVEDLRLKGIANSRIPFFPGPAKHFLTWLTCTATPPETVDSAVIERFLQHDCTCWSGVPALGQRYPWRKRRSSPQVMRFVRFLEQTGRVATPGDLDDNLRIVDAFLARLRCQGYARKTIRSYRNACTNLVVWLHLSRIRLRDLNRDALARFHNRTFACSIPDLFRGDVPRLPGDSQAYGAQVGRFLGYLVSAGHVEPLQPVREPTPPDPLEKFRTWLECHRGITARSIDRYIRHIAAVLPDLGDEPRTYNAELVRRTLFRHIEHRSPHYAKRLTGAMRMYLRFLVAEQSIAPALLAAVPTVPQWRLSALPRYICADDVERSIASCGDGPAGVRDRAILLLLARLALRAGDIVGLRLADIDWDRSALHVSGKTRRESALPLPQDVGDALYAYITSARPRTCEQRVFLGVQAPYRPFVGPSAVTGIARRALDRAEVTTFASRGAHVYRHSAATALLKSGATLEVIAALLRHASPQTTTIYAKTDALMLHEVAQPWIGGRDE